MSRELKEKSIRWLLTGVAFVSLLSLACIMLFLFMEGLPLFADYPLWDFLTGHLWYPTSEPPEFGIFPLIMGSLAVTILASCIAVPLGIMTAAYLAEIAASRTRRIVKERLPASLNHRLALHHGVFVLTCSRVRAS